MNLRNKFITALIMISFLICCKKNNNDSANTVPTCSDGIQNQGETGIDCGGPCSACGTCSDGIQNQGETGIDCGGPCPACATCFDGMQNQGETGIDCGGPCGPCPTFTVKVDGINFPVDSITVTVVNGSGPNIHHITGYSHAMIQNTAWIPFIELQSSSLNVNSYCLDATSSCYGRGRYLRPPGENCYSSSGTLNITSNDTVAHRVSGNFNFIAHSIFGADYPVTNGQFSVNY